MTCDLPKPHIRLASAMYQRQQCTNGNNAPLVVQAPGTKCDTKAEHRNEDNNAVLGIKHSA